MAVRSTWAPNVGLTDVNDTAHSCKPWLEVCHALSQAGQVANDRSIIQVPVVCRCGGTAGEGVMDRHREEEGAQGGALLAAL